MDAARGIIIVIMALDHAVGLSGSKDQQPGLCVLNRLFFYFLQLTYFFRSFMFFFPFIFLFMFVF